MRDASQVDDLEIGMVADPLASSYWPAAKAVLHPALMQGDEDWPEVEADLAKNDKQLWVVLKDRWLLAAAVTRIALTRDGEVAEVYLVGGTDYGRWLGRLNDTIAESAKQIGCIAVRAYGREGWRKPLGAMGWRVSFTAYEKVLAA